MPNTRLDPRLAGYARAGWESVCREMQLPEGGFTERQAAQQRERYGANRPAAARRALGPRLRRAFLNPFSLTLLALCVLAWVTELLPGGGLAHEGTAPLMTGMLLLSGLVRLALEMRAHRQAQQLQRRTRLTVPLAVGLTTIFGSMSSTVPASSSTNSRRGRRTPSRICGLCSS